MFTNPFVKKNIVCIGGGNAMPKVVLSGLKNKKVNLTVVSAVLDSGGSSGRLRKDYDVISPGDIRRAFLELCNLSEEDKLLLDYRFENGDLHEHNLWNIAFVAMALEKGGYRSLFEKMNSMLIQNHKILPSTTHKADLVAVLENDEEIIGESNIDVPKHDPKLKIKKLFLRPITKACPQTVKRIKRADMVVIGPGDIYSSLMQVLLVDGTSETIKMSRAKKVYICNLMTKNGESNGFTVNDFVWEVENCLKCELDYVIFNTNMPNKERIDEYLKTHPQFLEMVKFDNLSKSDKYIGLDLLPQEGEIIHDSSKIAEVLLKICKQ
ncbi:MAG TPA: uridine diphosphate-N-acetylglucosamine-binding protein YvcK [Candidatus Pacearchaeota archaeon]|nr:uridine diphosphate-N-acetylglucosamine-binding protein YvcK [Candidatus Pacearchaeota archaeon]HPR79874.1 uridine diphosphate-N-acetylglucosamine-binding protein YvcK [Candidatus Pacearchaeota archaeon]